MIGTTISHFRILEELGSGGMGTVYKAEDLNLHRTVALKFLQPQPWIGEVEQSRFLVEARSAAALSHDAICTVFSIEEFGDSYFIAMEYVDGSSLKDVIAEGPLPIKNALQLAAQAASGLALAHENGIIHRDIKAANVMATARGRAKILDFGLARISGTTRVTLTGATMGTVAYMSPEQARGGEVDHRTDIWSLGILLYEMITGQQPFRGDSDPAVTYAITNLDPEPLQSLRSNLPAELEMILAKALAKDPDDRYQHADDLLVDLKRLSREDSQGKDSSQASRYRLHPTAEPAKPKRVFWPAVLGVGLVLTLAWFLGRILLPAAPASGPVTQFTVPVPANNTLQDDYSQDLAVSPDGSTIVFVVKDADGRHLVMHLLETNTWRDLADTEDASGPFFSPDGRWLGFFSDGKLKKINLVEGLALTLCQAPGSLGGHWGEGEAILLATEDGTRLLQVAETGGRPESVPGSQDTTGQGRYLWPHRLPDQGGILVVRWTTFDYETPVILLIEPETGEKTTLVDNGIRPLYLDTGHILFLRDQALMAIPFDLASGQVMGQAFMVEPHCGATYALAGNGTLVRPHGGGPPLVFQQERRPVWVDRSGVVTPVDVEPGPYVFPVLSPNGLKLGLTFFLEFGLENRILDLNRGIFTRLTERSFDHIPVWSPDGREIAFSCSVDEAPNVFVRQTDGSGSPVRLTTSPHHQDPVSWSPDGRWLTFVEFQGAYGGDIKTIEFSEDGPVAQPFITTEFDERHPMISRNGQWVVFTSNRTGRHEVFLASFSEPDSPIQISTYGGTDPLWSPRGDEVFFWSSGEEGGRIPAWDILMSAPIDPETGRLVGEPVALFQKDWVRHSAGRPNYDVSSDGQRFLVLEMDHVPSTHLWVILNWLSKFQSLRG